MDISPDKESINSYDLGDCKIQFRNDDYHLKQSQEIEFNSSLRSFQRKGTAKIDKEARRELRGAIRYGQPISVSPETAWLINLFLRSAKSSVSKREDISVSYLLDHVLRNSIQAPDKNSYISKTSMMNHVNDFSSKMRKYILIKEGEKDLGFETLFIPDLTYHEIKIVRQLLLGLVSPDVLFEHEKLYIEKFLKKEIRRNHDEYKERFEYKHLPDKALKEILMKTQINFTEMHESYANRRDEIKDEIRDSRWTAGRRNFSYSTAFLRDVLHFSYMKPESIENLQNYFESLRKISSKFGTIVYQGDKRIPELFR